MRAGSTCEGAGAPGPPRRLLPPLLQPLLLRHLEDKPPLAPGAKHLLLAVVRGVGHVEGRPCRNEESPWLCSRSGACLSLPCPPLPEQTAHPRTCS